MQPTFDNKNFSEQLRVRRAVLNIDMGKAAEQIGVSKATLSRLENGHIPELLNYAKACTWLDVGMNYFILPGKKTKKTRRKPSDQQLGA